MFIEFSVFCKEMSLDTWGFPGAAVPTADGSDISYGGSSLRVRTIQKTKPDRFSNFVTLTGRVRLGLVVTNASITAI